jgi:sugar lactone lactonase YvrE
LLSAAYGEADGRLLVFHPASRRTTVVLDGLAFPNGVALSKDESWVAVVETNYARILRHWLKGPRAGETEVLVDGLPGAPLARGFTPILFFNRQFNPPSFQCKLFGYNHAGL